MPPDRLPTSIDGSLRARTARVPETRAVAAASLWRAGRRRPGDDRRWDRQRRPRRGDARADGRDRLHADAVPDDQACRRRRPDRADPRRCRHVRSADPRRDARRARERCEHHLGQPERRACSRRHSWSNCGGTAACSSKRTVTASEGAPAQGTFATTLVAPTAGAMTIAAYAPSAEDGTPQHEQDVPVVVTP